MKIELDLPVPEGWRFVGYQLPKKGEGYMSSIYSNFNVASEDFYNSRCFTFERIEPVDEELEQAKKLIGKWVKIKNYHHHLYLVEYVTRDEENKLLIWSNGSWYYFKFCTPFPIPVWRCCESDKPKIDKCYPTRLKSDHLEYFLSSYHNGKWSMANSPESSEWLDEGER
jgi:hypothetical protein